MCSKLYFTRSLKYNETYCIVLEVLNTLKKIILKINLEYNAKFWKEQKTWIKTENIALYGTSSLKYNELHCIVQKFRIQWVYCVKKPALKKKIFVLLFARILK